MQLEVQCPPGVTIGFVAEHWNLCRASYSIQNQKKENMMRVRGPCATYGCGSDSVFEVNMCKTILLLHFPLWPQNVLNQLFLWMSQGDWRVNYELTANAFHMVSHGYLKFSKMWMALPFLKYSFPFRTLKCLGVNSLIILDIYHPFFFNDF